MDAYEFLKNVKELIDIDELAYDNSIIFEEGGNEVVISHMPEDMTLYCHVIYQGVMYYYGFSTLEVEPEEFEGPKHKLELAEDLLEKITAIVNGTLFDTRITIQVDLDEDVINSLMRMAHDRDITLNQLMEELIRQHIDEVEKNNSCFSEQGKL